MMQIEYYHAKTNPHAICRGRLIFSEWMISEYVSLVCVCVCFYIYLKREFNIGSF